MNTFNNHNMKRIGIHKFSEMIFLPVIFLMIVSSVSAFGPPPTTEEIAKIEKRGKEIANYEQAAIMATDLLLASNPDKDKLGTYVAINKNKMWAVFFGKNIDNKFQLGYFYSCPDGEFDKMRAEKELKDVPRDVYDFTQAVNLATKAIELDVEFPPYNPSVFREDDGTITVYFLPGNKDPNVILIGGDFKVSISGDATKVLNKTKLHTNVLNVPINFKEGEKPEAGFHTHVLIDLPTETDVALVLMNPQMGPHFITGRTWMSKIDPNGKINILGKTEEILK